MDFIQTMKAAGIRYDHVHTSGHATEDELQQFVAAFPEARVIPIHLVDRDGFGRLSVNVELKNDLEWWEA